MELILPEPEVRCTVEKLHRSMKLSLNEIYGLETLQNVDENPRKTTER